MKKVVWILVLFLVGIKLVDAETALEKVTFVRCVDGDTAVFKLNGEEVKYRFLAIDTPETVHPTKDVEAFGKNASEYTCNKLTNAKEIIVEYETSNKTDKYGRSLGWIWIDGSLLQKELISVGYAEVAYIYGTYRYTESLCLIQSSAKNNKLGMWNEGREEGYCSTVDLSDTMDNIDYEKISENVDDSKKDSENISDTLKELDKITDKLSKFAGDDNEDVANVYFYIMIGAAVASIIYKQIKK